jgi:hypothetical protein
MKFIFSTTRSVERIIVFRRLDGVVVGTDTVPWHAGRYVFRGNKRSFAAHLAALNAEYGTGFAVAEGGAA